MPLYFLAAKFIYTPLFYMMSVILPRCGSRKATRLGHWFYRQIEDTFFNQIVVIIDGFFLPMVFSSTINIKNQEEAGGHDLSFYLSIFFFTACMLQVILV